MRHALSRLRHPAWLGTVRRTAPLSEIWGHDRGRPIDRFYIERFLDQHRRDIHGRVLEIRDNTYTRCFGGGVVRSDILDVFPTNPMATIITDLAAADAIASNVYDCVILTQTLQYVPEMRAALVHTHRILRPGGVLLATLPGIARVDLAAQATDYWRFTVASCTLLFGEVFGAGRATVRSHGNVLVAIATLLGMAQEELRPRELETSDEAFPVLITVRAMKQASPA
ncbi:MAG: methyltransferase domain-containing protein [Chloroflexi bacterium]|nr:methyltransferase domain-containing protein [Chloroflexota bacterium]